MAQQFFQEQSVFSPILGLRRLSCVEEMNYWVNPFFFPCSCYFSAGEAVYHGEKITTLFKHRRGLQLRGHSLLSDRFNFMWGIWLNGCNSCSYLISSLSGEIE